MMSQSEDNRCPRGQFQTVRQYLPKHQESISAFDHQYVKQRKTGDSY